MKYKIILNNGESFYHQGRITSQVDEMSGNLNKVLSYYSKVYLNWEIADIIPNSLIKKIIEY